MDGHQVTATRHSAPAFTWVDVQCIMPGALPRSITGGTNYDIAAGPVIRDAGPGRRFVQGREGRAPISETRWSAPSTASMTQSM
jgi:hypothetical protein